jgi:hypothetical protein
MIKEAKFAESGVEPMAIEYAQDGIKESGYGMLFKEREILLLSIAVSLKRIADVAEAWRGD